MATLNLNDRQLLETKTTDGLSVDQIMRRSVLINMQAAEVSLDKSAAENEKYKSAKEQELRQWKVRMQDIKRAEVEQERIQKLCRHFTGGQGRQGFYAGADEAGYGRSVSRNVLPTSELYGLCFRCGKEWHHPNWIVRYFEGQSEPMSLRMAVVKGLFPLAEYDKMVAEYADMLTWKARTFDGEAGEYPAASLFKIPQLEQRFAEETAAFQAYLAATLPKSELRVRAAISA
jgi:hypothetical protein